jgi:phospho-2-dehydro-3-deoxyheptonate aldolase
MLENRSRPSSRVMTTDFWSLLGKRAHSQEVLELMASPCSVHDPEQALAYCKELLKYAQQAEDDLLIVMRVYFEKYVMTHLTGMVADIQASNDSRLEGSHQR